MTRPGWLGALLVATLALSGLLGDAVSGHSFDAQDVEHALEGPSARHWMGSDALGRDLFARVAEGGRVSLLVAVGSTLLALLIGLVYGGISGYVGGRTDGLMMRAVDVVYSLPDVLVIVLLIEVFQASLTGVPDLYRRLLALVFALGGVGWVTIARMVRGLILQAREEAWVEAARALGVRSRRLLVRHILPNISGPILVTAAFRIPAAILPDGHPAALLQLGRARQRRLRGHALLPPSDPVPEPGDPDLAAGLPPAGREFAGASRPTGLGTSLAHGRDVAGWRRPGYFPFGPSVVRIFWSEVKPG